MPDNETPETLDLEAMKRVIDKGREINQRNLAASGMAFMQGGIQLFPSDYLRDDQMVVSRAMYEATVKACKESSPPHHEGRE